MDRVYEQRSRFKNVVVQYARMLAKQSTRCGRNGARLGAHYSHESWNKMLIFVSFLSASWRSFMAVQSFLMMKWNRPTTTIWSWLSSVEPVLLRFIFFPFESISFFCVFSHSISHHFGLISIGLSCLIALFLYHVFGAKYLGILNEVAAFVIMGIGKRKNIHNFFHCRKTLIFWELHNSCLFYYMSKKIKIETTVMCWICVMIRLNFFSSSYAWLRFIIYVLRQTPWHSFITQDVCLFSAKIHWNAVTLISHFLLLSVCWLQLWKTISVLQSLRSCSKPYCSIKMGVMRQWCDVSKCQTFFLSIKTFTVIRCEDNFLLSQHW